MKKILLFFLLSMQTLYSETETFRAKKFTTKIFPIAVASDEGENVYIIDRLTHSILKYDKENKYRYSFGIKQKKLKAGEKKVALPVDIFVKKEKIYVLDINYGILIFNLEGKLLDEIEYSKGKLLGEMEKAKSIFVDEERIYVADTGNHRVQIFNLKGEILRGFSYKGSNLNTLKNPQGIFVKGKYIFVSDTENDRVKIFDKNGFFKKNLGVETTGTTEPGSFKSPKDIFIDDKSNIYIVDTGNNRIQIFDERLKLYLIFGEKGSKTSQFNNISDIWVDKKGQIYLADTTNKKIKILSREIKFIREIDKGREIKKITKFVLILSFILVIIGFIFRRKRMME